MIPLSNRRLSCWTSNLACISSLQVHYAWFSCGRSHVIGSEKRVIKLKFDTFQATTTLRYKVPWVLLLVYKHPSPSTEEIQTSESVAMFLPKMMEHRSEAWNGRLSTVWYSQSLCPYRKCAEREIFQILFIIGNISKMVLYRLTLNQIHCSSPRMNLELMFYPIIYERYQCSRSHLNNCFFGEGGIELLR